jgi:D-aminopeptidase
MLAPDPFARSSEAYSEVEKIMTKITFAVALGLIVAGAVETAVHQRSHLKHKIVSVESAQAKTRS